MQINQNEMKDNKNAACPYYHRYIISYSPELYIKQCVYQIAGILCKVTWVLKKP